MEVVVPPVQWATYPVLRTLACDSAPNMTRVSGDPDRRINEPFASPPSLWTSEVLDDAPASDACTTLRKVFQFCVPIGETRTCQPFASLGVKSWSPANACWSLITDRV